MIRTVLWSGWLSLKRDRIALLLVFVLPIIFFSIFAGIFINIGGGGGGMPALTVVFVDADGSDASERLRVALAADASLRLREAPRDRQDRPYTRDEARTLVTDGDVPVAIVVPEGFGESFGSFGADAATVELLADKVANPVAHQMVGGLLQKAAMTAAPDLMISRGVAMFEQYAGGLTESQQEALGYYLPRLRGELESESGDGSGALGASEEIVQSFSGPVSVSVTDVRATGKEQDRAQDKRRLVAFYAAGIGVMFLLFSMTGAMGALIQEESNGTLERLLNCNVGMGTLLMGYWGFAALIGFLQLSVMFLWGWLVFGLELWTFNHVTGFIVMTAVAAAAASGFGLMLGTACRSQGQLQGLSTVAILIMSAVGGSMFPRFMMPEAMQKVGLATFNGWAIDGYQKVFWRDETVLALWPQVLVLGAMAVVFLVIARRLARRWEYV